MKWNRFSHYHLKRLTIPSENRVLVKFWLKCCFESNTWYSNALIGFWHNLLSMFISLPEDRLLYLPWFYCCFCFFLATRLFHMLSYVWFQPNLKKVTSTLITTHTQKMFGTCVTMGTLGFKSLKSHSYAKYTKQLQNKN